MESGEGRHGGVGLGRLLVNKDWEMRTGQVKGDGTVDAEGEGGQVIFVPPGGSRGGGGRSRGSGEA